MTEKDVSRVFAALEDELGLSPSTPTPMEIDDFFIDIPQKRNVPTQMPKATQPQATQPTPKVALPVVLAIIAIIFSFMMGFITHSHNKKVDEALASANIIVADASKEAKSINDEAYSEAAAIIADAESQADKIMEET